MAHLPDPFIDALRDPKLIQRFQLNKDIAVHLKDEDFLQAIEKLHDAADKLPKRMEQNESDWKAVGHSAATEAYADPRIMQAIMTLYGKPSAHGTIASTPEPLQAKHLEAVEEVSDAEDAKAKGNEFYKRGDFSMALAHYQRAMTILRMPSSADVHLALMSTLLSNSAICLIKLNFPDRAKTSTTHALRTLEKAGETSYDKSKLFYRRALACEQLEEFAMALDDMNRAFKEAQRKDLPISEQNRLRAEAARVEKLHNRQIEEQKKQDGERFLWNRYVEKDVVKEYEEANKWSSKPVESRFDDQGQARGQEGRVYAEN